jgi:hypothetical protein
MKWLSSKPKAVEQKADRTILILGQPSLIFVLEGIKKLLD